MLLAGSLLALASAYREQHAVDVKSFGLSLLGLASCAEGWRTPKVRVDLDNAIWPPLISMDMERNGL